eukprot:TRINITY_DN2020_c0_g1_i1.p1 TRINITY_DN2020_c0_g1~~TRINITY_DN2020_c0_g1_i1.p1  ORF type:complete len:534 (+),score=75.00 TRINITY_DN2020_c0_g1_i1:103-1602(+)
MGYGSFGTVYRAICRKQKVAVKVLHNQQLDVDALEEFANEIEIMSKIHHPQVVMFMGACTKAGSLMIVTELMKTDLQELLFNEANQLSLFFRLRLAKESALGLNWLHCSDPMILHRDVKPKNFLLGDKMKLVVSDFGFAENLSRGNWTFDERGSFKGSLYYTAPEIIRGASFNEKSDIYSWAIVLWVILERKEPYEELADDDTETVIKKLVWDNYRPEISEDCPEDLKSLIVQCWDDDPEKRPSFDEVLQLLDHIIVNVAVDDTNGREFWKQNFLAKEKVSWKSFWTKICSKYIKARTGDDHILKAVLGQKSSLGKVQNISRVSLENFGKMLSWFGPLYDPLDHDLMSQIRNILKERWFHGTLSLRDCESRLSDQPCGTFLIRFSESNPGDFVIGYVDKKGTVEHKVIERIVEQNNRASLMKQFYCVKVSGNEISRFNTLRALVSDQTYLRDPCPGSPFTILFRTGSVKTKTFDDVVNTPPMNKLSPVRSRRESRGDNM